jgi:hypothetical protein
VVAFILKSTGSAPSQSTVTDKAPAIFSARGVGGDDASGPATVATEAARAAA